MGRQGALDKARLDALKRGDEAAWRDFLEKYDGLIRSVLSWPKWHFDFHAREDLAQNVRAELVKGIGRYDGRSSIEYWIKRVCVHRCIDEVRRQVRRQEITASSLFEDEGGAWDPPDGTEREGFDPVRAVMAMELAAVLRQLVEGLGDTCRTVIHLFYLESLSYQEIAARLGISLNTVGSRLSKCLDKLRAAAKGKREWQEDT